MYANVDSSNPYALDPRVYGAEGVHASGNGEPNPAAVYRQGGLAPPASAGVGAPPAPGFAHEGSDEQEEDYVYFVRNTDNISKSTLEAARSAKMRLEHSYRLAVDQAVERSRRYVFLPSDADVWTWRSV